MSMTRNGKALLTQTTRNRVEASRNHLNLITTHPQRQQFEP